MRTLLKALVLLALGAAGACAWSFLSQPAPLWTERRGTLQALMLADSVTGDQDSWRDWSSRMFVPIASLDAIGQQYVGTVFTTPLGSADSGGAYDGSFELTLEALRVTAGDAWLEASLSVAIRFAPERAHHEWSNVSASVVARAMLIPEGRAGEVFRLRVVPTTVAPSISWRRLWLGANETSLISEAIGSGAVLAFADALMLEVRLPDAANLSTRIASTDTVRFEQGGGQTEIIANYAGTITPLPLPFDVAAPTAKGVWLIARRAGAPELEWPDVNDEDATERQIEELRRRVRPRLNEWPAPQEVLVEMSAATLESVAKELFLPGTPSEVQITTDKADGDIGHIENVLSEYVDRASLKLRPNGPTFARGTLKVTPGEPQLTAHSLTVPLAVDLTAIASLNLHKRPALMILGDGVGVPFDASGTAHATLEANLTGEVRSVPEGRAAILQPAIGCKRIQVEITSDVNVAGVNHRIGVRRQQHVGGSPMDPVVLIDDQPLFVDYQSEEERERNKSAPSRVTYPAERIVFRFNPSQAAIGSHGLNVSAAVSVSRDSEPRGSERYKEQLEDVEAKRVALRKALKDAASEVRCTDPEETALIADGLELGPTNDLVVFAQAFAAIVTSGGAEAVEQTKKWFSAAIANPGAPPPPPPSVGLAVINAAARRAGVPEIPIPDAVKPPVTISDNCVEHCPPFGPCFKACR